MLRGFFSNFVRFLIVSVATSTSWRVVPELFLFIPSQRVFCFRVLLLSWFTRINLARIDLIFGHWIEKVIWNARETKYTQKEGDSMFYRSFESHEATLEERIRQSIKENRDWTVSLTSFTAVRKEKLHLQVGTSDRRFRCRISNITSTPCALDLLWGFLTSRHVSKRSQSSCGQKDTFSCSSE